MSLTLGQELDLPAAFRLGFIDEQEDFATAVAEARDPGASPQREMGTDIAAVLPAAEAEARARSILADAWVMRERLELSLPPSMLDVEPGDAIIVNDLGPSRTYRVTEIEDRSARRTELVRVSPSVYEAPIGSVIYKTPPALPVYAPPLWELMDLPLLGVGQDAASPFFAAYADPWPGAAVLYRSIGEGAPALSGAAPAPRPLWEGLKRPCRRAHPAGGTNGPPKSAFLSVHSPPAAKRKSFPAPIFSS